MLRWGGWGGLGGGGGGGGGGAMMLTVGYVQSTHAVECPGIHAGRDS